MEADRVAADPEAADRWICELEKIFVVLGCSPEKRLAYAVYMLVGEADHWWRGTYQMLAARGVTVDWECFRTVFMEKYFPESVRHAKETEFMRLHQGGMTAKVVERLEGGNRVARTVEGPSGSKRGGSQRKPYDRPQPQQGGPVVRQPSSAASGGRQGGGAILRCYRCVGPYFVRDCPQTESRCFRCHQMGHESANCPTRSRPERSTQRSDVQRDDTQRSSVQRADTQRGDRPTTTGRVFALTGAEASTSSDLVKGKGEASGKDVMILFDAGASHSFISYACAAMLAGQAKSLLRDGAECCLLLAALSVETERVIAKIDVVRDFAEWERPRTVTDIRSFVGLAGYYQRFIEGFSTIVAPLPQLTWKK
ncbi:uncharacterized protein LOC109803734 [Cajanus cajan]|uniref:uncharacterized protein LOC109803734 n=1 Tax=Cajanus cajan TaxID=3821 RepID=UPI00098DCCA3|nr:uncharacterized protein LOC109803734 [Cajanus cajan]